jgi:uncharacterized protein involved in response to NO
MIGRLVGLGGPIATIAGMADLTFIPVLAVAVGLPIILAKSKRNFLLLALLPALWLCDVFLHMRTSGLLPESQLRTDLVAVDVIVVILVIVTGRIVPLFTKNALNDDRIRSNATINTAAIVSVLAVALVELVAPNGFLMAVVAGISALLVFARSLHWGASATLSKPILWVLHLGHAWIWFGLALKAAAAAGLPVPPSVATHALTAGAIGTLTLGMMARVTLGHTGRVIEATPVMIIAFVSVTAGAVLRVFGPWFRADLTQNLLVISAGLWSAAFALYLAGNSRILMTPRPDGKEG